MSDEQVNESPATVPSEVNPGVFLPLVFMGFAVVLGLITELNSIGRERATLQRSLEAQEAQIDQTRNARPTLERIATELLELAKTDPAAAEIVRKHGIQRVDKQPAPVAP